jgi:hypothetical protein
VAVNAGATGQHRSSSAVRGAPPSATGGPAVVRPPTTTTYFIINLFNKILLLYLGIKKMIFKWKNFWEV